MKHSSRTAGALAAIALIAPLAACSSASAQRAEDNELGLLEPGVLRVGTVSDSKPYAYTENGELVGFEVDVARAVAEEIGLEAKFVQQEFATLIPAVASGQLDAVAASTSITEERKQVVNFSDVYFIGYISVISNDPSITEDVASLEGKRLGLMQGTIQDAYAQDNMPGTEIVRYPDYNSAVSAMNAGSIDAVFIDYAPGKEFVDADPENLAMPINIPVPDLPVGMPVSKDRPELEQALNEAVAAIIASGELEQIWSTYYPELPIADELTAAAAQ